jgi:hypothetical protein
MTNVPPSFVNQTNDWQRRLQNASSAAQTSKEGDVLFLQASKNPLVSCFIVVGKQKETNVLEKEVKLNFVSQHDGYPKNIESTTAAQRKGYSSFKNALTLFDNREDLDIFKSYSFDMYKHIFQETCQIIDTCIKKNHGIMCFKDGDIYNDSPSNGWFLHVCDIMNIYISQQSNQAVEMVVPSQLLPKIEPNEVKNDLIHKHLPSLNLLFLEAHEDFLYMCYGYYANHSFIPIRTSVNLNSHIFLESKFFTNDLHFVVHQDGKRKELNQNEKNVITRIMYRSV